jgi:hypothetical protein
MVFLYLTSFRVYLEDELDNSGGGMLAPEALGLFLHACTNEVVSAHSIVLHAPKEMCKEFHRVHMRLGFVSSTPSA